MKDSLFIRGKVPMTKAEVGDYFLVQGENLVFHKDTSFSLYSLSALLSLLPAKQRPLDTNDWMPLEEVNKTCIV